MSDCQEHSYIYTHEGNAHHTIYHYHKDDCPYCHIQELEQKNAKLVEAFEMIANKERLVEHRPACEMQDIAKEALKEVKGE